MTADARIRDLARRLRTTTTTDARELKETIVDALLSSVDADGGAVYGMCEGEGGPAMGPFVEKWPTLERSFCQYVSDLGVPFPGFQGVSAGSFKERSAFLEDTALRPRHEFEATAAYQEFFVPVGLVHVQRLLVFDGDRFVAFVGVGRCAREPFTRRDRRRLQPLVAAVRRAVVMADALERKATPDEPAPLVLRPDGSVDFASSAGRFWLGRESFVQALTATVRALDRSEEPQHSAVLQGAGVEVVRLDGRDGVRYLATVHPPRPLRVSPAAVLTARQREVADLACGGATLAELARDLGITRETAKAHLKAIYRELEVSSRVELARVLELDRER